MAKQNQKHENTQDKQRPTTTPAAPLELSEEELKHVVGGAGDSPMEHRQIQPDPGPPGSVKD